MNKVTTVFSLRTVIGLVCLVAATVTVFSQRFNPWVGDLNSRQSLVQLRELAMATAEYSNDFSDTLPLGSGRRLNGVHCGNTDGYVPADWAIGPGTETLHFYTERKECSPQQAANLLIPYLDSVRTFDPPGLKPNVWLQLPSVVGSVKPANVGYTYNGLLSGLTNSEVLDPDRLTLFWTGAGNVYMPGRSRPNPYLTCSVTSQPCRYVVDPPGVNCTLLNGKCSVFYLFSRSHWVYGHRANYVSVTGIAETRQVGVKLANGYTDPLLDPFATYYPDGVPAGYFAPVGHPTYFRPDIAH